MADADRRQILKSSFDPKKMLELSKEEARRHLLVEFFVPLAHNLFELSQNSAYAVLHIIPTKAGLLPLISMLRAKDYLHEVGIDHHLLCTDFGSLVATATQVRTFGKCLNTADLATATEYAFSECMPAGRATTVHDLPLVATIKNTGDDSCELHVLTKTKARVRSEAALKNQAMDRLSSMVVSATYRRTYNVFSGEWEDLCPVGEECARCKVVRASKSKANFYDDPEAR